VRAPVHPYPSPLELTKESDRRAAESTSSLAHRHVGPPVDDVLLLILDGFSTAGSDATKSSRKRQTLYNVCLVSSRLCRLAQPISWRHVWIRTLGQVEVIETGRISYDLYACPRTVTITALDDVVAEDGLSVVDWFPNLVELRVDADSNWTSLSLLSRFSSESAP